MNKIKLCKDCHRAPAVADDLCRPCKRDQEESDLLEESPPGRPMRPYGAAPPDEDEGST